MNGHGFADAGSPDWPPPEGPAISKDRPPPELAAFVAFPPLDRELPDGDGQLIWDVTFEEMVAMIAALDAGEICLSRPEPDEDPDHAIRAIIKDTEDAQWDIEHREP